MNYLVVLFVVLAIIISPYFTISSINILFGTAIPFNVYTWLSTLWLTALFTYNKTKVWGDITMSVENTETLPEVITDEMREGIRKALVEMSGSFLRTEAESDFRKDIAERMKTEFNIPKREFNRLAKIYHASNLTEEAKKNEQFIEFAAAILATPAIEG